MDDGMLLPSTNEKVTAENGAKKRAASEKVAAAEHEGDKTLAKRAKVVKKGTAKSVKKSSAKVHSGSEDGVGGNEDKERVPTKPKGKGKNNVAPANGRGDAAAKSSGPTKAKKGKANMTAEGKQIQVNEDEDADVDVTGGDGHRDGMIEMRFDEAA